MDCKSTAKVNGIYQLQGQDMPRFLEEAGFIIMNNNDKYKSFSFNIGELILGGESIIAFVATWHWAKLGETCQKKDFWLSKKKVLQQNSFLALGEGYVTVE